MLALSNIFKGAPQMGKAKVNLNSVTAVGLDLAKHVFQIHAVDVWRQDRHNLSPYGARTCCLSWLSSALRHKFRSLRFSPSWARELVKLGHDARLMPPTTSRLMFAGRMMPLTRQRLRSGPSTFDAVRAIRSVGNKAILMRHKVRELLVSQRTTRQCVAWPSGGGRHCCRPGIE